MDGFQDITIDLSKPFGEASLPKPPPGLLDDLAPDLPPGEVARAQGDLLAVSDFMRQVEGEPRDTSNLPKRQFLVKSDDPDHPNDYILFIDNSSLENFNTCNRKGYYYSVLGREVQATSAALTGGGAFHLGLEQRYKRGITHFTPGMRVPLLNGQEAELELLQDAYVDRHYHGIRLHEDEHRTPSRIKTVLRQYNRQYISEPFQLLTAPSSGRPIVELGFAVPFGTFPVNRQTELGFIETIHIVWTGRIDLPITWDGQPVIFDHKTTLMLGPTFSDQFRLASQTIGYCWAANHIPELMQLTAGKQFQSFCLNAICIRKPTRTGIPVEFVRHRYFYDQSLIDEWQKDTMSLVSEFLNNFLEGYFPKKANWCIGKYGACPYLDVCCMPVGIQREVMLSSEKYKNVTWNPLDDR